jgi:hypothetical protein
MDGYWHGQSLFGPAQDGVCQESCRDLGHSPRFWLHFALVDGTFSRTPARWKLGHACALIRRLPLVRCLLTFMLSVTSQHQRHVALGFATLTNSAETAHHQGIDLYAPRRRCPACALGNQPCYSRNLGIDDTLLRERSVYILLSPSRHP